MYSFLQYIIPGGIFNRDLSFPVASEENQAPNNGPNNGNNSNTNDQDDTRKAEETIRVATYNTRFDVPKVRTVRDIKKLVNTHNADIVALQEINNNVRSRAVQNAFIRCGNCQFKGDFPDGDGRGELAVLWRKDTFKLLQTGSARAAGGQGIVPRTLRVNFVKLKSRKTKRVIYVLNNHLPAHIETAGKRRAGVSPRLFSLYTANMRTNQNLIRRFKSKENLVLSAGDFNVDYKFDHRVRTSIFPYRMMAAVQARSSYDRLNSTPGGTHGNRLIDYIFSTNTKKVNIVSNKVVRGLASDHNALVVRIKLKEL